MVTRRGTVGPGRLSAEAVLLILRKRAVLAGIQGTALEPVTPHGLRAGFVTQSYRTGIRDEEIMEHTCHRYLATCAATCDGQSSARVPPPRGSICSTLRPTSAGSRGSASNSGVVHQPGSAGSSGTKQWHTSTLARTNGS